MAKVYQIADLGDVEIAYFDLPSPTEGGPTTLLIHGFASTAQVNWVATGWAQLLNDAGYRVVALDNRGHGRSTKFYSPLDYGPDIFASDALRLLDQLGIQQVDILGYSMGARITSWIAYSAPERVRKAIFGGMGANIFGGRGGYEDIAHALEVDDPETIIHPGGRSFRKFADVTRSDRMALAACIRPSAKSITEEMIKSIVVPVLVAVGSTDDIGGSPHELATMMPNGEAFVIEGLDHMKATGAASFKHKTMEFLEA